jgi:hypothetical protein
MVSRTVVSPQRANRERTTNIWSAPSPKRLEDIGLFALVFLMMFVSAVRRLICVMET